MALREEELTSLCDDVDLERDRVLVERCQAGDSAAFGNLYARYYERLLRFCLRRLNDRHEAEDASQEAFARAWKALPRFAGERRFYPWLTVIAGNICTDMLRRRSRSTPTDDMELTAQHAVGVVSEDTSEELILAAVDGELVNRALGRLSTRHRHVLAMREGSGWTYQQIADHEGVEIGTIETLLWRARQALKREFAVVSESKEALAGFLIATGALIRRTALRAAHRGATVQHGSGGGSGALRNAVAGFAVTGAAVATAFIAPHALSTPPSGASSAPGSALAAPPLALGSTQFDSENSAAALGVAPGASAPEQSGGSTAGASGVAAGDSGPISGRQGSDDVANGATSLLGGSLPSGSSGTSGVTGGLNEAAGSASNTVNGATGGLGQSASRVTGAVGQALSGVTGVAGQTASGVTRAAGQTASSVTGAAGQTVSGATSSVGSVVSGLNSTTQSIGLGSVLSGTSGSGSSGSASSSAAPTTTTTNPVQGVVGATTKTVGGLLGG